MSTCHQIRAGQITTMEIPADGLPLLLLDIDFGKRARLVAFPGAEQEDFSGYTLTCVAEIATQITPWATVFCIPAAVDGDRINASTHGAAYTAADTAWIRSTAHPDSAIQTCFHECYHLAEAWLNGDEIAVLRKAAERGPSMPRQSSYNSYWCDGEEVRARAFEGWAYSHWLLNTTPAYRRFMPAHERLWTAIYRGDLGLRAARRGRIHRTRMPECLKARLAERSASQKAFDAILMVARAIINRTNPHRSSPGSAGEAVEV